MTELFFDVAILRFDGVAAPGGLFRSFADLDVPTHGTLALHARELTIQSVPADRHLTLVADLLMPPRCRCTS